MLRNVKFEELENFYLESSEFLKNKINYQIDAAIITGSGIDNIISNWKIIFEISYSEIPEFPISTVAGHAGKLIVAQIESRKVLIFAGRFHIYEGRSLDEIISPVLISNNLGIKNIIISNAAGGLNHYYNCGDIMLIDDTINFTSRVLKCDWFYINNKLPVYFSQDWLESIKNKLTQKKISYQTGTYVAVTGPNYETKAEIRMFRTMNADAIGMSTVHESAAAYFLDMNVLGFSIITNKLSDTSVIPLSHEEVLSVSKAVSEKTKILIETALESLI